MIFLTFFLVGVFLALAISVLAGVSDLRSMTIPNSYSVYMIAAFAACYGSLSFGGHAEAVFGSFSSHLFSAGIMFFITFLLFALGVLGAGDSKFGTVCALWISVEFLPIFLFFMTLCGGMLGLGALYIRNNKPFESPREGSWIAQVQSGKDKVPYGVAIFFGLLAAFMYSGYFSGAVLSSFVE